MTTTAYERLFNATAMIRDEVDWPDLEPDTKACSCCQRSWAKVEEPERALPFQYGRPQAYKLEKFDRKFAVEWQCTTCQTLRESAPQAIGIERLAGGSTPVGQRLSMLTGGGAVITTDNSLHLAVKPGHWKKFQDGRLARAGRMHICDPFELLIRLSNQGELGRIEDGIVLIGDFGRQPDNLMRDLRLSTDWREVCSNNAQTTQTIDALAVGFVYGLVSEHGHLEAAQKRSFWLPLINAARGQVDTAKINKWVDNTAGATEIAAALPINPYQRVRIHQDLALIHSAYTAESQKA